MRSSLTPTTRRLLAAAVVGQPLLIALNALFHPAIEFSGAGILAGAAEDPGRWYVVHVVAALGALLGAPAAVGLRLLVSARGRRAATAGVALAFVGAAGLAMAFAAEASVLRLLAVGDISRAAAVELADAYTTAPEFFAVPAAIVASMIASLLLGAAVVADRPALRWPAVAYVTATVATAGAAPGAPLGPVAFGGVTVAAAFLAAALLGDGREVAPEPHPALS